MTTTQKAVLLHPMGSMGEEIEVPGHEWSGIPGDPFLNLTRVVTEPQPWDFSEGEAA